MGLSCIWHDIFHIYCPGCGGTRAVKELMDFHLVRSFLCNPLPILLFAYLCLFVGTLILEGKNNCKGRYGKVRIWGLVLSAALWLAFGFIRDVLLVGFQIDMLGDF